MKKILELFRQRLDSTVHVVSIALGGIEPRWVYGKASRGEQLAYNTILLSGGLSQLVDPDPNAITEGTVDFAGKLQSVLSQIEGRAYPRPQAVVFCLPASRALTCELRVPEDAQEMEIRLQIEDLLVSAAGEDQEEMAYDWQIRSGSIDDEGQISIVVSAIHRSVLNEIEDVCKAQQLQCLGITLDNIAAINGHLRASAAMHLNVESKIIMYGEISRHMVKLSVFSEGYPVHESHDASASGFSVVQSVASLERLVEVWFRGSLDQDENEVKLIVGGELMNSRSGVNTIKRSKLLADKFFEVKPLPALQETWHGDVVPYGALEGMPCA